MIIRRLSTIKFKLINKTSFLYFYYFIVPIFAFIFTLVAIFDYLPPASIKILSGPKEGFFSQVAEELKNDLLQYGVKADIEYIEQTTEIIKNIQEDEAGYTQIGFLSQEIDADDYSEVVSLGAIAIEPLLIVARRDSGFNEIRQLKGQRIIVGPIGSGVRTLSEKILNLFGIDNNNSHFMDAPYSSSGSELVDGRADAAFFLLPASHPIISELYKHQKLRLLAIPESRAISNKFKYLINVSVPRGAFQIEPVMPQADIPTVALPVSLITHKKSGIGLGGLIAAILAKRYDKESFFVENQRLPEFFYHELKRMPVAEDIYANGEPALARYIGLKFGIILSYAADPIVLALASLVVLLGIVITYTEIIPVLIIVTDLFRSKR